MTDSLEEMGNPFLEETKDLMRLDTRDIIDYYVCFSSWGTAVWNISYGPSSAANNTNIRAIVQPTISKRKILNQQFPDILPQKPIALFFLRLYIACQSRDGNLAEFFRQEN